MRLLFSAPPGISGVNYQFRDDTGLVGSPVSTGIVDLGTNEFLARWAKRPAGATGVVWNWSGGVAVPDDFYERDRMSQLQGMAEEWLIGAAVPTSGDYVEFSIGGTVLNALIWWNDSDNPTTAPGIYATEIEVGYSSGSDDGPAVGVATRDAINTNGFGVAVTDAAGIIYIVNALKGHHATPNAVGVSMGGPEVLTPGIDGDIAGTAPTVAQIDAYLSGIHGAGLWTGALSGPSSVTLTFKDASAVVVPYVLFHILQGGNSVGYGMANASGVAAFGLTNGSYSIVAFPTSGVTFPVASLTVSGTTSQIITGSSSIPTAPPPANDPYCDLTMDFATAGQPATGGKLMAELLVPGNAAARLLSGFVNFDTTLEATSDGTGRATLRVVRNTSFATANTRWLVRSNAPGWVPTVLTVTTGSYDCGLVVL